jgi:alpha-1,6-mannosyl-glycoprotein beta-1,2-N-acetylglucosaminyltransferase
LEQKITLINHRQYIRNEKKFGSVTKDTILITIQVHNRITYLKYLIESLKNARDIEKALLIFSHDVYDEQINKMISKIDFCMVMQIFYPFSIQLYPNQFPGTDPRDCKRDVGVQEARKIKCLNSKYADTYNHFREAKYTQMKHHW